MSLEGDIGEEEFWISGGSEFQDQRQKNPVLPREDRTYGTERTSESEDHVKTEYDGNERRL